MPVIPVRLAVALSGALVACNGHATNMTTTTAETTSTGAASVEVDGMMQVAAGPFWRGCNAAVGDRCEDDPAGDLALNVPYRAIELAEFWIDKYEVTFEDYRECGTSGSCTAPNEVAWDAVPAPKVARLPVTDVTWVQADAYCRWRGKRLPTEAEWEKAARGGDGRRFPWGNVPPECGQANLLIGEPCERLHGAAPVDAFPDDVSPYGVVGMIGNVQEWVHDWRGQLYYAESPEADPQGPESSDHTPDMKIVRGGYWDAPAIKLGGISVSLRRWGRRTEGAGRIGFRCVRSGPP